jgi:hypothetical protein
MLALFMPAQDMHPDQARALVPPALWALSASRISRGLAPQQSWPAELDGRRLSHKLALLPRVVLEQVGWNLGLLSSASNLRRLVLRHELQLLADQGMQEADWALVLSAPRQAKNTNAPLTNAAVAQWPALIRHTGQLALAALATSMDSVLAQRLSCKLAPTTAAAELPAPDTLELAYTQAVGPWSAHWDRCLGQLRPGVAALEAPQT